MDTVPQFETDEIIVGLTRVNPEADRISITPNAGTLLILLNGSGIQTEAKGKPGEALVVGGVIWLLAGSNTTVHNSSQKEWRYLTIGFKGSEALYKH